MDEKKRPEFIGHYQSFLGEDNAHYPGDDETLAHGSPIGKKLGLEKMGVHVETLYPGRRTSYPHAERDEEEFIYVISGNPQVWIDGVVYDLEPGDGVAFPAGTGTTHTFINNSDKEAKLLVVGEATKPDTKVYYPKNPERNDWCQQKGYFWEDWPKREIGDHDGLSDRERQRQKNRDPKTPFKNAKKLY